MANQPLLLLLLLLSITTTLSHAVTVPSTTTFISEKCSATQYASLCVSSLSAYAAKINRNSEVLAQTALSVSLQRAQSAKAFVDRLSRARSLGHREAAALRDCVEEMDDMVDRLSKSAGELQRAGRVGRARYEEFVWHMSNVQTWVSAALTDDSTCVDEFGPGRAMNGRVKSSVRAQVDGVVHYTSNALALINQYANKH
ncbi:hypothetical protein Droror1_Dr00002612 [Drosera rotundifolia]